MFLFVIFLILFLCFLITHFGFSFPFVMLKFENLKRFLKISFLHFCTSNHHHIFLNLFHVLIEEVYSHLFDFIDQLWLLVIMLPMLVSFDFFPDWYFKFPLLCYQGTCEVFVFIYWEYLIHWYWLISIMIVQNL